MNLLCLKNQTLKRKKIKDPLIIQRAIEQRERELESIDITQEEMTLCRSLPRELKDFYRSGNRGGAKAFVKHYRDFTVKYNQPI